MTLKIIIRGKVQGVFFRDSTKNLADKLNIRGTVENLSNGDVKIIAQGKNIALKELVEWCKDGPQKAEVKDLFTEEVENANFLKNFIIKRW